ncbi:MAG: adenylyltransferase/cytidyltransferase family protein, partial [Candidatus Diapherotrites archaeon]|nr:adenylyltransferase/cytidyltransferase family protein [Candidatus Diapherotrites archaeon]
MIVAVFRGTFDPPHLGHLGIIKDVFRRKLADRVCIVLRPGSSHSGKKPTPLNIRARMVLAALKSIGAASRIDVVLTPNLNVPSKTSAGKGFTERGIQQFLVRKYPGSSFVKLCGGDKVPVVADFFSSETFYARFLISPRSAYDELALRELEGKFPG